jgi:hypothetical protein
VPTIENAGVIALAQGCPGLQTIDLNGCEKVMDAGVIALAQECPGLQTIKLAVDLDGCGKVTDVGVIALAQGCPGLQNINLNSCGKVTDAGVRALAQGCPGLQTMDLNSCEKVTDAGVIALAQECPGLQSIGLRGCSKVTKKYRKSFGRDDIDALRREEEVYSSLSLRGMGRKELQKMCKELGIKANGTNASMVQGIVEQKTSAKGQQQELQEGTQQIPGSPKTESLWAEYSGNIGGSPKADDHTAYREHGREPSFADRRKHQEAGEAEGMHR